MQLTYREHTLDIRFDRKTGSEESSIVRNSDGYVCYEDLYGYDGSVSGQISYLRELIDKELLKDDPWGEKAEAEEERQMVEKLADAFKKHKAEWIILPPSRDEILNDLKTLIDAVDFDGCNHDEAAYRIRDKYITKG